MVIYYSPGILLEVAFIDPLVLYGKISELVKVHHDKIVRGEGEDWHKFYCHALVTVEFLYHEKFKMHCVPGLPTGLVLPVYEPKSSLNRE